MLSRNSSQSSPHTNSERPNAFVDRESRHAQLVKHDDFPEYDPADFEDKLDLPSETSNKVSKFNDQGNFPRPTPSIDQYRINSSAVVVEPLLDLTEEATLYSVPVAPMSDVHPSAAINPTSMDAVSPELYAEPVVAAEPDLYTSPSKAVSYSPTYAIPSATEVYATQTECLNKITSSSDNAPCKCINSKLFPHRANKCSLRTFTGTNTTANTNTPATPERAATVREAPTVARTGDLMTNIDQVI